MGHIPSSRSLALSLLSLSQKKECCTDSPIPPKGFKTRPQKKPFTNPFPADASTCFNRKGKEAAHCSQFCTAKHFVA